MFISEQNTRNRKMKIFIKFFLFGRITYWRQKMSNCVCWFVSFVKVTRKTMHNKILCCFFFFFSPCLFIQLLILNTLSSTSMHTHMLLLLLSSYQRWLDSLFTHSKRIFIYIAHLTNDVVVNVRFFLHCYSLSLCRFLPAPIRTREKKKYNKPARRVDKLFYTLEYAYVYVCVLPLTSTHFFLYILSIFPFTPFCNRQMKVKKKRMHWIHTSFQGRWGQASPRIVDDIFLRLFFSSSFLSIYLFRSFFSHYTWFDSTILYILCPNSSSSNSRFFVRLLLYIVSSLSFLYITPNIYNKTPVFSFFLSGFFKKKLILTDCFFLWDFFMRVCFFVSTAAAPTAFLFRLQYVYIYIYVRMYEKKNEKRNMMMMKDEEKKKQKLRTALLLWLWFVIIIILEVVS